MKKIAHIEIIVTAADRRFDDPHACTVRVRAGAGPTRSGRLLGQRTERGNRAWESRDSWARAVAERAGYELEAADAAYERHMRDERPGA